MADILGPSARVFCTLCICVHIYIILIKRITKKKFLTIFKCTKVYNIRFCVLCLLKLLLSFSFASLLSLFPFLCSREPSCTLTFLRKTFFFFFMCVETRDAFSFSILGFSLARAHDVAFYSRSL